MEKQPTSTERGPVRRVAMAAALTLGLASEAVEAKDRVERPTSSEVTIEVEGTASCEEVSENVGTVIKSFAKNFGLELGEEDISSMVQYFVGLGHAITIEEVNGALESRAPKALTKAGNYVGRLQSFRATAAKIKAEVIRLGRTVPVEYNSGNWDIYHQYKERMLPSVWISLSVALGRSKNELTEVTDSTGDVTKLKLGNETFSLTRKEKK